MDWLIACLLVAACLSSLGVRKRMPYDATRYAVAGRNLVTGGYAILALRFIYVLASEGRLPVSPPALIGLGMLAFGAVLVNLDWALTRREGIKEDDA